MVTASCQNRLVVCTCLESNTGKHADGGGHHHHDHGNRHAARKHVAVGVLVVEPQDAEHQEQAGGVGQGVQAAGGDGGDAVQGLQNAGGFPDCSRS